MITGEIRPRGRGAAIGLAAVCALVVGLFWWTTTAGYNRNILPDPTESTYHRLVEGFRAGHLYLRMPAPPGLVALADPYDPQANYRFRQEPPYWLHDLSYYRGRLYSYFGPSPAVLLYWPWAAVTGQPLSDQRAAAIFCSVAFLAGVGLLRGAWRRYFPAVPGALVAAGALAFGLATEMPVLLQRAKVYEVAISGGLALTMLALAALWRALHSAARSVGWLAAAALAYGLAIGARPALVLGAPILFWPIVAAPAASRRAGALRLAAVALPLGCVGAMLAAYNVLRFGSPWEFGQHFQLAADRQGAVEHFSPSNLWFNFRMYFLEPVRWRAHFPFVEKIAPPSFLPAGHAQIEDPFGILTNVPLAWLALAVPGLWRTGPESSPLLRRFLVALALLFGISTLTLLAFYGACSRYEAEFLPELILLSLFGLFAWDSALARRPIWRRVARGVCAGLLIFSVGFNLLNGVYHYALQRDEVGKNMVKLGRPGEAVPQFEWALRIKPDFAEAQVDLGNVLAAAGQGAEAMARYREALRLKPDLAEAHNNLGSALDAAGRTPEAMAEFEAAVRFKPDFPEAQNNLGNALRRLGRGGEAIAHYEEALRLKPDFATAHFNLAVTLAGAGRPAEAISQLEQALKDDPNLAQAEDELGGILANTGRLTEAIPHLEKAVKLDPANPKFQHDLGAVLGAAGRGADAAAHLDEADRLKRNPKAPSS